MKRKEWTEWDDMCKYPDAYRPKGVVSSLRRVRKEVRQLCVQMCNTEIDSKEWNEAKDELIRKWKFTPFNLLALYNSKPTIEYNADNMALVLEKEASK